MALDGTNRKHHDGHTREALPRAGSQVNWYQILCCSGYLSCHCSKGASSFSSIEQANEGSLNHDQYRGLMGFLEHVRNVLFLRGDKMYGLCEPLNWKLKPIELLPLPQMGKDATFTLQTQAGCSSRLMSRAHLSLPTRETHGQGKPLHPSQEMGNIQ